MAIVAVALLSQSLNLAVVVGAQEDTPKIAFQSLACLIVAIAGLAELYRQAFDLPVAESEVVGGPVVEYSGIRWSMFQLGEFVNLVLISILGSLIFLGGWQWPWSVFDESVPVVAQIAMMAVKTAAFILFFMWM